MQLCIVRGSGARTSQQVHIILFYCKKQQAITIELWFSVQPSRQKCARPDILQPNHHHPNKKKGLKPVNFLLYFLTVFFTLECFLIMMTLMLTLMLLSKLVLRPSAQTSLITYFVYVLFSHTIIFIMLLILKKRIAFITAV